MKARFALIWGFFILLVTITTSSPVFSLSLSSVDLKTWETTYQSDEVWDPTDWMGLTGAGNEDGYLPRGNGGKVICSASTMSLMQWWQFWRIAGSTSAHDTWHWTSVYQLSGDPGQRAGIELDYDLWSSYGLTAAMVTSFEYSLTLNELPPAPIPEPATLLLIGIGLIGLAACRGLVRNIKSSTDAAEKMMAA